MRDVTREELWDAMDGDTQEFTKALLTATVTLTQTVDEKVKDRPLPVKVEKKVKTKLTVKSITIVNKELRYENPRNRV